MKDIKDYFSSPTKIEENELVKTEENIEINELVQQNIEKLDRKQRKLKRKKKRKHSDPAVRDVTELLSNSLKLVSPGKTYEVKNGDLVDKYSETVIADSKKVSPTTMKENKPVNNEDDASTTKKNAFKFMMESRNRSIGLNSPGKEIDKESSTNDNENKEKLAARRQIFSSWSDKKGAVKRKRFEEEKDEIIEHKLKKRAKKLKNLLNIESEEQECLIKVAKRSKKNRIKKLSSSSEDSDFDNEKEHEDIGKGNETNKKKVGTKKDNKKKNKELEIKNARKLRKEAKKQTELQVSETKNKNGNLLEFIKSEKLDKSLKSQESSLMKENATNKKKTVTETKNKDDINENGQNNIKENKTTELQKFDDKKENKSSKHKKHSKKKNKIKKPDSVLDESSQESGSFTQRTLRSWKMRIKINEDVNNINTKTESRSKNQINYAEDQLSDDLQEDSGIIEISSDTEDQKKSAKKLKKSVKMAPIFTPKPKEDPAIVEARKKFLMSGIPSSLKRTIEKQNSLAEQQFDIFRITHHIQQKSDSHFWNLPKPHLNLNEFSPLNISSLDLTCRKLTNSHLIRSLNIDKEVKKVDKLKILLNKIKSENPNYPVYKSFRQIHAKSGHKFEPKKDPKTTEKRKKRGRKKKNEEKPDDTPKTEPDCVEYTMWTEKYKPKCSEDIIGNVHAIKNLKKWLYSWKNFSQEINSNKRHPSKSSESEFEITDDESKDSTKLPGKIVLLGGPCGSGKSTAVYAICNELGFNVIELNASSKRTGKRLLQEIQEATQSHQVQTDSQSLLNVFQSNSQTNEHSVQQSDKKMCVLLIEDVDIVFEQDDGFISALIQLTLTSKRPIIATTTDYGSMFIQKFLYQYEYIQFLPLSSYSLSTWLQIVFICEGLYVSREEIGSVLEYNNGDVRKTLLHYQFWVQSDCQIVKNVIPIKLEHKRLSLEEELEIDESNERFFDDFNTEYEIFEHKNCIRSFEILEESFKVPFYLNLGLIWWNIPNILNLPNFSKRRIDKLKDKHEEIKTHERCKQKKNKEELLLITKVYDSLSYTDVLFRTTNYYDNNEPLVSTSVVLRDSLELRVTSENKNYDLEFVHELTHTLVNGSVKNFTENSETSRLNIAIPDKRERRWRTRLEECKNAFKDALSVSTDKKSIALDYMPVLRTITRSECSRAANNTKRGNRFRNYLRDLGIRCNENTNKIACNILS